MEVEEEDIENDEELLKKFSKHKNDKHYANRNDLLIRNEFNDTEVQKNENILNEYEKMNLINHKNYYCMDKNELENPIEIDSIKNTEYKDMFKNELDNECLYCGYLDHEDEKGKNKNSKEINCPYCFNGLTDDIIKSKLDKERYAIIGKSKNIFKNYNEEPITFDNLNKYFDNIKKTTIEKEFNKIDNYKNIKFILLSCISCGHYIGIFDPLNNIKIILEFL